MRMRTALFFVPAVALILFTLAVVLASPCFAQVATGTPRFGTFAGRRPVPPKEVGGGSRSPNASPSGPLAGGPDIINLGNLNAHLVIPIVRKAGRGMPFAYNLNYDSSIWQPVTSGSTKAWQITASASFSFGWNPSLLQGGYAMHGAVTVSHRNCGLKPQVVLTITAYSNWAYVDGFGTPHPFVGTSTVTTASGTSPGCLPTKGGFTATASDGSGYTITVLGSSATSVTAPDGTIINPVIGAVTVQDRNGNEITSATSSGTTTYTDTLGTSALATAGFVPTITYSYTNPQGTQSSYTVKYTSYTVQTNFGCSGVSEFGPTTGSLVSEIDFPDISSVPNDKYTFTYEATPGHAGNITGRLASITLPTGGTISYSYSGGSNGIECVDGSTAGLTRQTPDGTWNYSRTGSGSTWTTTIQDPQGNQTAIQFQEESSSSNFYETQQQVYQGSASSGTLMQTTNTCYNGATSPCTSTAITLPISSITKIIQLPGSSNLECKHVQDFNSFGLLTEQDDYDYGSGTPGPLLRKTDITYAALGNNINSFSQTVAIADGSGTTVSDIGYSFDGTSVVATNGTPQHVSVSGARGNVTSIVYNTTTQTFNKSSFTYFDTGNVQTATNVRVQTTYNYANATATCGNAVPTSVSEPLGLSHSMTWNCTGGVQVSATDENGQIVSTTYNDANFWRPASMADQENNSTNFAYANPNSFEASLPFNSNNSTADVLTTLDVLGRTHLTQKKQSPSATAFDSVETDYDGLGRPSRTTVPYSGTSGQTNSSGPATTQTYDALNRPLVITDGGGGTVTLSYSANDVLQTVGPAPSGENTKRRQFEYNSLGELTSVCEITNGLGSGTCGQTTPATGYWTKYTYDGAGRLLTVTQNAQSSTTQTRSYTYDQRGRMTSETNPETGKITYVYDSDSTCGTSTGDLVKRTDNAGNVTCYAYDLLDRVTSVTYPSGPNSANTPGKFFVYDGATISGNTMANAKARLAEAYTATCQTCSKITDEGFSYTARGEVATAYEITPHGGAVYNNSATYWPNGALDQLTGLGFPMTYGVDGEGRPNSVSTTSGQNPVTATTYNAASEATGVTFGSGDSDGFTFDPNTFRMTQYKYTVGATPQSVVGTLTWNANGSLGKLAITDAFNAANTQTCTYSHDDLARIASGNCGSVWSQTFTYDAFGNITKTGSSQFQPGYNPATNQMSSGATYDSNGDVLTDSLHSYAWDVETRPTTIDTVTVTYDALERMVEQSKSGTNTEIIYGPTGAKLALYNGSTLLKAFVPLPGGATAVYSASGLQYYRHADWLGSSRFSSTPARAMFNDLAFAPFGEQYAAAGTTGVGNVSFAGNNQDTTTNLYDAYFREYGIQGRWPSPDPAGIAVANPANPQSWNRYAYVMNNPLGNIDRLGLWHCVWSDGSSDDTQANGGASETDCFGNDPDATWVSDEGDTLFGDPCGFGTCAIDVVMAAGLNYLQNEDLNDTVLNAEAEFDAEHYVDPNADITSDDLLQALGQAGYLADSEFKSGLLNMAVGDTLGVGGAVIGDLAAGPLESTLFGRFNTLQGGGFPGYLNSGWLRIGYGWDFENVFRIGIGSSHIDLWPSSRWLWFGPSVWW